MSVGQLTQSLQCTAPRIESMFRQRAVDRVQGDGLGAVLEQIPLQAIPGSDEPMAAQLRQGS